MLEYALSLDGPSALRYPRGNANGNHVDPVAPLIGGRAEVLRSG